MGEQNVSLIQDKAERNKFIRSLLDDVKAMEYMIQNDWFESDIRRIGAEQEMVLVDKESFKPKTIAVEVLEHMSDHSWMESELAKFNLEIGLSPLTFSDDCLHIMQKEIEDRLEITTQELKKFDAYPVITGILPTLRKFDLELFNLTPKKRYNALMEAINKQLLGSNYELNLSGIDELMIKHESPMLEAVNTSFQVHLQVSPNEFAQMYNIAQVLAAPVMAIAANSPIVFGRRLWHESRIAMFQQSIDTRSSHHHMRERMPRVYFGQRWLDESILEIYKDDISRFRVLMTSDIKEKSLERIAEGKVPKLKALQVHNSTVYRWNRPCYGISDNGKPHLRIENRVLPAGPTIADEMANASFWLGLMVGFKDAYKDVRKHFLFADAQDNFFKAAKYGIDTKFSWTGDRKIAASDLVLKELIPIARQGLMLQNVNPSAIDYYLGIIEDRAERHMNGARWMLRSYTNLLQEVDKDEALTVLTACIYKNQKKNNPISEWEMPTRSDLEKYRPETLTVGECMTTDILSVQKDDLIDLVGELMDWRKIRYVPVENSKGKLEGLITHRIILKELLTREKSEEKEPRLVEDIMVSDPLTVNTSTSIKEAMEIMRDKEVGCLLVVENDNDLIGLITEMDFLRITARLLDQIERN